LTPIIPKLNAQKAQVKLAEGKENIFQILKNKHFIGFALCMMNSNACYFAFLAAAPFLLKQFGYTPTQVGYAFCASSFPYMFGSFFGRKLSKRHSYLQIILLGLMFDALGVVTMILLSAIHWQHMLAIMIPVFLISIGNGFIMPYSSASAIALSPKNAGFVTGTLGTLQLCAASFGTFMMGVLANGSLYPLALFNSCVVSFTLCYFLFVFRGQINKRIN
jgi:MFS transporter, DHA1 family, multidrug resistance protein